MVTQRQTEEEVPATEKALSRREFLRIAGVAGATVGVGAGLGGLVAACGEETTTTTTGGGATTTTTSPASTTTVSAGVEEGRPIKIGWSTPQTGGMAGFGIPNRYQLDRWNETLKDGLVCGDGKNHKIEILFKDNQSDPNRASQITADMILNDKADIIFANSSPELCIPVSDQCESLGAPGILVDCPWQPWYFRSTPPPDGWKWSVLMFWGVEDLVVNFLDIWSKIPTNKIVGALWPNDPDGNAFRGLFPPPLQEAGYTVVDPGGYPPGMEDFTTIISDFKKGGVEIVTGAPIPPDFTTIWKQAVQQGLKVKICTIAKAMLFPASANALGDIGVGVTTELWWHRKYPFKSSLTGETCEQLAEDFEKRTGEQWNSPLLHYVLMEVAVDALKRVNDVESKDAIMKAIMAAKLDTIGGPIDFSAPVAENSNHPVPNVSKTPQATAQWRKGTTWPYELSIIGNARAPMVEIESQPIAMS